MTNVRSYGDHEFCKSINCEHLRTTAHLIDVKECKMPGTKHCPLTAKEFHKWLSANNFMILKYIKKEEK